MTNTEIPEETVKVANAAYWAVFSSTRLIGMNDPNAEELVAMEAGIAAALPALRKQWAEEVATFAEEAADDLELPVMPEWLDQRSWFKGQLHALAARVREYGETTP